MAYFKSAATKVSHSSTFAIGGNKDLRPLQDLITAEKSVLNTLVKLSTDLTKASDALKLWGQGEGDDLTDVLSGCHKLLTKYAASVSRYASHEQGVRDHMKSVRAREETLDNLKVRRKNVSGKAEAADKKLSKMGPENKNVQTQTALLMDLRTQTRDLDAEILAEEASLGDFKREATRSWMTLKFGGLQELSEKGLIAADFGKLILTELPHETTQPGQTRGYYLGQSQTEAYGNDAQHAFSEVVFHGEPPLGGPRQRPRPAEASMAAHEGMAQGGAFPDEMGMVSPQDGAPHSQTFSGPPGENAPQRGFGATRFSTLPTRLDSFDKQDSFTAGIEQGLVERGQSFNDKRPDMNKRASEQYYAPPSGPPPGAMPPVMPDESAYGGYDPGYGPADYQNMGAPGSKRNSHEPPSPLRQYQHDQGHATPTGPPDMGTPKSNRVPVPQDSPPRADDASMSAQTDESARNAAAAREIAREMDALGTQAPYQPPRLPTPEPPADVRAQSGSSPYTAPPAPASPFARRRESVVPRSPVAEVAPSPTRRSFSPIPVTTEPPPTAAPAPLPEGYVPVRSPPSPPLYSPIPVPESPPATAAPAAPLPSAYLPRNDSSYRSPQALESPLPAHANGSTTSLGLGRPAPVSGGARTISAAAFRRPAQRTMSDAMSTPTSPIMGVGMGGPPPGVAVVDTSPLSVRKRGHEQGPSNGSALSSSQFSTATSTPSLRQFPHPPEGGHHQRQHGQGASPEGGEEDNFDYISAYLGSGEGEAQHRQGEDFR